MRLRTLLVICVIPLLSACGPFKNKYVRPETTDGLVRVLVEYKGDFVYPQPLYFGEGKTCSSPQDLLIDPQGEKEIFGSFEIRVGYAAWGLMRWKSSFPAIRNSTVRMVSNRP